VENRERQRDQDLKDLMRQEEARGRRPVDPDAEREQRELVQGFRDLINGNDEKQFREGLTALGYQPDSERFEHFLAVWRSLKRRPA